jgi:hypothetical protein
MWENDAPTHPVRRSLPMSLRPQPVPPVPEDTVRVAHAAFRKRVYEKGENAIWGSPSASPVSSPSHSISVS